MKNISIIAFFTLFFFLVLYYSNNNHIDSITENFDLKENKLKNSKLFNEEKWIVVTTINYPTEQCKILSRIKGFKFLVIGDQKTPKDWKLVNAHFLNLADQEYLNLLTFKTTPINSYNRKNIGYLFAIMNGAKYIYDTDDDNSPLVDLSQYFNFDEFDLGLVFKNNSFKNNNRSCVNPYAHFGQPTIWPRGFPLSEIKHNHFNEYYAGLRRSSIIQQGLVNGDPDVDAIFRLTKSRSNRKFELYFDSSSPSVQIPKNIFSPFNSQNTLFSYKAFWSLYLPITVSFRLTDIWRSYWAQRLMWLLDETLTFRGPSAFQIRNSHSYLKDFDDEKLMYLKTENLIKFLLEWKCLKNKFYECVIDLSIQMANKDFWGKDEISYIKNWLNDLNNIGYQEPIILNFENKSKNNEFFEVRYSPEFQKGIDFENYCCNGNETLNYEKIQKLLFFQNYCKSSEFKIDLNPNKILNAKSSKVNYTLLITFNNQCLEGNIIFLKNFYEDYFQNIIFCGVDILNLLNSNRYQYKKFDSYSFIEYNTKNGHFHGYCMSKAIEMNYNTAGILLMSDDVMLKYWRLKDLDPNKIWFVNWSISQWDFEKPLDAGEFGKNWWGWGPGFSEGIIALKNLWKELNKLITENNINIVNKIKIFFQNLKNNQLPKRTDTFIITSSASDLFYIPKRKFELFNFFSKIFQKHEVFHEIGIPTILSGIDAEGSPVILNCSYTWGGIQFNFKNYNSDLHFAHPMKLSNQNNIKQICELFIKDKFSYENYF